MRLFSTVTEALHFLANLNDEFKIGQKYQHFHTRHVNVDRTRYLLQLLHSPQRDQNIIHIAGTSGKGSTTTLLAELLRAHGFKVGALTSPHVVVYNERFSLNGQKISSEALLSYINKTVAAAGEMVTTTLGYPGFKAINTAIAYQYFQDNEAEYSVIETEMGGLYDETNTETTSKKISIITDLGLDHMSVLGTSLTSIAYHKAGIFTPGSTNFAIWGNVESNQVLTDIAFARNCALHWVKAQNNYEILSTQPTATVFNYTGQKLKLSELTLGLIGEHQVRNASLALRALEHIAERDHWQIDEQKIRKSLILPPANLVGRIAYKQIRGHDCFFDVAHNLQKVEALVKTLQAIDKHQKYTFIISFKETKDFRSIIEILTPLAARFIVSSFDAKNLGLPFHPTEMKKLATYIQETFPTIETLIVPHSDAALQKALEYDSSVVVTGSFYLLADMLRSQN